MNYIRKAIKSTVKFTLPKVKWALEELIKNGEIKVSKDGSVSFSFKKEL